MLDKETLIWVPYSVNVSFVGHFKGFLVTYTATNIVCGQILFLAYIFPDVTPKLGSQKVQNCEDMRIPFQILPNQALIVTDQVVASAN